MAHAVICCPRTGLNVQVWLPERTQADPPDKYEAINCPGCARLHFVNKATGKLLNEK